MDGLTPDRVSGRRSWRASARKSGCRLRSNERPDAFAPEALGRTVEHDVIPRLLSAHRNGHAAPARPDAAEVAEFARCACTGNLQAAEDAVARRRAMGSGVESLLLDLLVPAASQLAARWQADLCRYEELAVGMLHLQQLLHGLSADFVRDGQAGPSGRRVLLLSAPAEQDMLGLYLVTEFHRCVVAEFFHHAGWDVWRAPPASRSQLASLLRSQWFDVVAVDASSGERLALLPSDLAGMRRASRNARAALVVGGLALGAASGARAIDGADAVARDPRDMLSQAEALVALRDRPRKRPSR
jgi:hypothetical protein